MSRKSTTVRGVVLMDPRDGSTYGFREWNGGGIVGREPVLA